MFEFEQRVQKRSSGLARSGFSPPPFDFFAHSTFVFSNSGADFKAVMKSASYLRSLVPSSNLEDPLKQTSRWEHYAKPMGLAPNL